MKRALAFVLLFATRAVADDKADARAAYERGTAAYGHRDFSGAAKEYALADALAPNAVALQAALDAAVKADDPVLGAELLERAKARPAQGALAKSIETARAKLGGRAGKLSIACMDCTATVDGAAFTTGWVRTGKHDVILARGNSVETKSIDVAPDATVEVSPSPPRPVVQAQPEPQPQPQPQPQPRPEPLPVAPAPSSGISPVFFFAGVGATAAFGIASIAAGAYTASAYDDFVKAGCPRVDTLDCRNRSHDGNDAQIATNVLLGGMGIFAVATVVSIFFVRWKAPVKAAANGLRITF